MLASKNDFIGLDGIAHLACGGQPPLLKVHQSAFDEYAVDKSVGMNGFERHWTVGMAAKSRLGAMTGLPKRDFALLGNASEAIVRVISSLNWKSGENAVVSSLDYASGRFALAGMARHGVELRQVEPRNWFISDEDLLDACDENTRLLYISQINSLTGQQVDLTHLSEELGRRNIVLLADVTHALGVLPVDGTQCDFLVSSTYKFLLSPHSGILGWNRNRRPEFEPSAIGWASATPAQQPDYYALSPDGGRAEIGNPNHLAVYLLRSSLDYLAAIPGDELQQHVAVLTAQLYDGLKDLGIDIMTPADTSQRGPNISFLDPHPRQFVEDAALEGILLWGENGRVRASTHAYVTQDDVDRLLKFTATRLKRAGR